MGLGKKTIDDQNYCGKKVLVRCDFNVPMKDGVITNENRINAALPTIQKLVNDGAKVILCSHLGKPKNGPEAKFSLAPVAVALSAKLGKTVVFADDDNVVGENAKAAVAAMNNGDVVLLQNTRFRKEETKNMPEFSEELASLADAYVDDAFGSCHRAHCSTAGVTDYIKDTAVGYLMEKEIKYLGNAVNDPVRPFTAIHRPGAKRVQGAIFFRQPVGNAEGREQRHDVIGRFDRVQHFVAPGIAKYAGHHLTVAGNRQVGEYQEKRTNQHKRHIENNAVAYRQDMLLAADFQRGGHDIAFNK